MLTQAIQAPPGQSRFRRGQFRCAGKNSCKLSVPVANIRTAERLKAENPLIAGESRPWSIVQEHGPVLRRAVPSLKCWSEETSNTVIPTKLLVGIWMLLLHRSNQERRTGFLFGEPALLLFQPPTPNHGLTLRLQMEDQR